LHWRRWALSDIPLEDQAQFEAWLLDRWREKDELLEHLFETGRFPTSLASSIDTSGISGDQKAQALNGYIETDIRLAHWIEIGMIFAVLVICAVIFRYLWGS
jgi:hypothetical protein